MKQNYTAVQAAHKKPADQIDVEYHSARLENSYAGILGKSIEPAIKPLGYDWRIGIALITSFAAREVFVGTMATLFSVGEKDKGLLLRDKIEDCQKGRWLPAIYSRHWNFTNDILSICHAMHEHSRYCTKRNQKSGNGQ